MMSSRKAPSSSGHDYALGDAGSTRASHIVVVSFWGTSGPRLQPFLVIARHAFVTLGEGNKLLAADDIVDVLERFVPGAAIHLVKYRIRRRLAVSQHDLARRRQTPRFIGLQRGDRIGTCDERI